MSVKIAVCDDEKQQTDYIRSLVLLWSKQEKIPVSIVMFDSAEAFLFSFSEDKNFDILLLDIQMNGQNGIELAKTIRQTDKRLTIIFITGYPDFIGEGYEVSALHYLIKPIKEDKLFEVLSRAYAGLNQKEKALIVLSGGESIKLFQKDILYAEAFAHTVIIHTSSGSWEVKQRISNLEQQLDAKMFIRCHRSYLVGLSHIERITRTDIVLDGGQLLPLSRRLYHDVNQAFIRYFKGEIES